MPRASIVGCRPSGGMQPEVSDLQAADTSARNVPSTYNASESSLLFIKYLTSQVSVDRI